MLHGIEFRAVWRLSQEAYVLGNFQILGLVPACLVHLHNDQKLTEIFGYFLEEDIHHICVSPREQQSGHSSQIWTDGSIDVEVFPYYLSGNPGTHPFGSPAATRIADTPKSALILRYVRRWSGVLWIPVCQDLCYFLRDFFLNSSWISCFAFV